MGRNYITNCGGDLDRNKVVGLLRQVLSNRQSLNISENREQALEDSLHICIEKQEKMVSILWDENDIHKQTDWWHIMDDLDALDDLNE